MAKVSDKPARIKVDAEEAIVPNGTLKLAIQLEYYGDLPKKFEHTIPESQLREALRDMDDHIERMIEKAEDEGRQLSLIQPMQDFADEHECEITLSSGLSDKTATIRGKKKAG